MNANRLVNSVSRSLGRPLLLFALAAGAHAATTALSSEPITSSSSVSAKPNILFVLDDSGSMNADFLPDWAGPYQATISGVLTVVTPPHRFFNGAYNGVAYNPGTRYRPPVMYTSAGVLDTTSYPSQTGQGAATGGDGSATALLPNWRTVKADGYGVQSAATVNLEGNAFSYTTVAGEYCDSVQLRNCVAAAAPTGIYTFPAKLRWCTTSALSVDTTANAGTNCQASNIDDSATNLANGVTPYTFPRIAAQRSATLTVAAAGTVSGITVDGVQILFATATGGTSTDLATDIAAKINACTYGASAGPCTAVGYTAVSLANVVNVKAPGATTSMPVVSLVSGGPVTPSAFSGGNLPGATLFSVITPQINSYTYPGTLAKNANRSDCVAGTCTYAEEMTNYANWYTYYRTRMQMMKTASSIAFANVDNNFRVGYFSINNGASNQFLNLGDFDGTQKNLWYSKFFSALPFGATPLRSGLASAGQLYAGKLSVMNGVAASDPMQYACQQNFTILSTDGYWNDASNPTQLDGTDIGEQDGNDPRPFYDGATQTRTASQTTKSELQVGINTWLVESRTRQLQTTTAQLSQSVVTTTTWPYNLQTSTLQTRTTPLNKTDYGLVQSSYPLTSITKQLQESTYLLQSTTTPLNSSSYQVVQTSTPLQQNVFNITRTISPLQSTTTLVNSTTAPLQSTTSLLNRTIAPLQSTTTLVNSTPYALQSTTTLVNSTTSPLQSTTTLVNSTPYALQSTTTLVNSTTSPLQSTTTFVNSTPYALQSTTTFVNSTPYPLQSTTTLVNSTTSPLQRSTSLIDVTTYALQSSTYSLAVSTNQLQQNSRVSTDGGDTYSWTGWTDVGSCTTTGASPVRTGTPGNYVYTKDTTCRYATAVITGGQSTCTPVAASTSSPYTIAQAVSCAYETTPSVAAVGSCTTRAQDGSAPYRPSVACGYSAGSSVNSGQSSCTANDQTGASSMSGNKVVCSYDAPTTVAATSCTPTALNTGALPTITCGYGTAGAAVHGLSSCTANNQPTNAAMSGDKVVCAYDAPSAAVAVGTCTATTVATGALPQIACGYGAAGTKSTGLNTCSALDQTGAATMTGDKVVCAFDAPSAAAPAATCTATVAPTTAAKKITCAYSATAGTKSTGLNTCSALDQTGAATMTGDKVVCAFDLPSAAVPAATCTATVAPTTAAKKITCGYGTAGAPSTGLNTCTAKDQTGAATMTGDKAVCAFDAPSAAVPAATCTATVAPTTAAKKITCAYSATAGTKTTGLNTCSALDQTGAATMTGNKVVCAFDLPSAAVPAATCTATVAPTTAAKKITCGYGTAGAPSTGLNTCTAKDQTGAATMTGDKVVCAFDAPSTAVAAATCTATVAPTTAAKKITCAYSATAGTKTTGLNTCSALDQTGAATMTGDKVVCAFDLPSAAVAAATCTPTVAPTTAAKKITCGYGTPGTTTHGLSSCTSNNQPTTGPMTGDQVICGYDTASAPVNVGTCTPAPATGALPAVTCGYGTPAATVHGLSSCTANSQPTTGTMTGNQVICAYDTPSAAVGAGTCTPTITNTAALPQITCGYGSAGAPASGQTSCTANSQATTGLMTGDKVACVYDATPTTTPVANCTATTTNTGALPKTTCTFTGTPVVTNPASCAPSAASGPTNFTGPQVTCGYTTVTRATNIASCTPVAASLTTTLTPYMTCDYGGAGSTNTGLTSCTVVPQTGPTFAGPAVACAYTTTASVANVASCTTVNQDLVNFSAPQKTCAYEAVGTPATNLASCTDSPQSPGPTNFVGPNVSCAYSTIATTTNPGSCTVNVEAGPSYAKGAKISCAYAAGVPSTNVASCTIQAQQTAVTSGSAYAPATDCAYGATMAWANATLACVPVAQSAGPAYVGPARECQYTPPTAGTLAATCTPAAQDNTNLTAISCDNNGGAGFPVVGSAVVTNNVDSCSTALNGVQSGSPIKVSTNTNCAYQAPVTANATSCAAVAPSAGPNYVTSVSCSNTDTGYVPVAPSCTPVGTPAVAPAPSDFSGGKIVECRSTDTTPYTVAYPSGAVPVASCTAGTDPASKVQTSCTTLLSTGPTPVDPTTCVTTAPTAPSYVATTCTPSSTSVSVMGCTGQAASSPLWQTVTCADNGDGTSNTLADVAAYYYKTDLRTPALGNCTGAIVPPATVASVLCSNTDAMNIVRTSPSDPNPAQHMTTFTLGLGASGYMKYSDTYTTDTTGDFPTVKGVSPYQPINGITANPGAGICSWQSNGLCNWPFPTADAQNTVDDLWHAAVNGHGMYYSAGDPASLAAGISSALNGVAGSGGTAAAPAVSTANLNQSDNYIFSSSYATSEWTGDLVRSRLNPYTGVPLSTTDWSAQGKLDANAARNIYTFSSGAATKVVAFTSANFAANANFNMPNISTSPVGLTQFLCASPDVCLSASDQGTASGANLVNYLRGDRTNEGVETDNSKYYRQRQHLLGDMVNAQTVYVSHPMRDFIDPGYSNFVTAQANRRAVVYAGANDGMLHAFAAKGTAATETLVDAYAAAAAASAANTADAGLLTAANTAAAAAAAALAADSTIGQEIWAYIPSMVLPNLYKLADKKYRNNHRYFVDATPVIGDICTSNCGNAATAVWKTILVGGLGHGGRGYYALDITNPGAAPVALWEFTDANLGYSYGNPQIAKMSDGTWVVMLTSGYNNGSGDGGAGDGVGRLYVLNAATGAQIASVSPISTGYGDPTDPSGLANISAMVTDPQTDSTTLAVYGGDLSGNLWRFDINDSVGPSGVEAQLLAVLEDATGRRQPITTKPAISIVQNQKVVYVGTGRFLDASDSSDTSPQTLYAIKDPWTTGGSAATAIFDNPGGDRSATTRSASGFVPQSLSWTDCPVGSSPSICTQGMQVMGPSGGIVNPVDFRADNGWFIDLINSSERANTNPALGLGLLAFVTNAPSLLACDVGGKSYLYFLNYLNGGPIVSPENPGGLTGYLIGNTFASAPTIVVLSTPDGGVGRPEVIFGVQDPSKVVAPVNCVGPYCFAAPPTLPDESKARRTSWREVIAE